MEGNPCLWVTKNSVIIVVLVPIVGCGNEMEWNKCYEMMIFFTNVSEFLCQ